MRITVGGFTDISTIDAGNLLAFTVFFQGCKKRCPGCHNPELQPFDGGMELDIRQIKDRIWRNRDWYEAVVLAGGEPLEQPEALEDLLEFLRGTNIESWLYTGYEPDEIPATIKELADVIVAGPYRQDLHAEGFPASSNQRVVRRHED
ncbi:anaerobic ribonucleoside-triphosphate reductase activating protein [Desulfotomaculum arcticum]|uniref:Anaerobic ribonucleoside-triphosphate reductase activating protein n=1 Tax=Desulfotruncus arcticus DSM 17038 TaxID=1121424 RepID=A0A1I2Y9Q6_9FIRM|nr:4Fe-4S single cluster domain-containing protein [Desulfotruncus arcticus]SFH22498.1 anaerobic ribonucleoside-triphosphate reductase activating protein [Desulfotomaculum arcticum] [Desulfotruncus arcticus DSM 17038]